MPKFTGTAQKSLDRIDRRERRLKRRKNRMPIHGKGLLTITEKLAEKDATIREKIAREEKQNAE